LDKKFKVPSEIGDHSEISKDGKTETYYLVKFERTSPYGTCYNQKVVD
jgi:hypothetical protein